MPRRPPTTRRGIEALAKRMLLKAQWLKPGVLVDYHSIIGEGVTKACCRVEGEPFILEGHTAVVFIEGVTGVVAVEALSPAALSCP